MKKRCDTSKALRSILDGIRLRECLRQHKTWGEAMRAYNSKVTPNIEAARI